MRSTVEGEPDASGLRYSFGIKRGSVTQEVGADAASSQVLEIKAEGPNLE